MNYFNINYHFISFFEVSLGVNIGLSDPCIQIHLPFGFIRIGWLRQPTKLFTFTTSAQIQKENMNRFKRGV